MPTPAWLFHRALALTLLVAWLSLSAQVRLLIGAEGLEPVAPLLEGLAARGVGWWKLPTFLWITAADGAIVGGTWAGMALAAAAFLGWRPQLCFALSAPLYLSYATAGQSFLSFQWDNLMVEASLLAAFLPAAGRRWTEWLLQLLLFKVMFESGVAKWQSHLGDWHDGSAMLHYYETAPLPAAGGWYLHHLPAWLHRLESWWTLFFELVVPFGILLGRRARLAALIVFAGFLVLNAATANYGFFLLQTGSLMILLLRDADVLALWRALWARFPSLPPPLSPALPPPRPRLGVAVTAAWVGLSALGGLASFADVELLPRAQEAAQSWRAVNVYHLFGHITTERIEPEFQTFDGKEWTAQHLKYKPGPLDRRPPYVAPHQPRVDFRLWFYGLSFQRGAPGYVERLVDRLCRRPDVVQPLFAAPLPAAPQAVRLAFYQYNFTAPAERAETGNWWKRERLGESRALPCAAERR